MAAEKTILSFLNKDITPLTLICSDEATHYDYESGLVKVVDGVGGSLAGFVAPEEKLAELKNGTTGTSFCLPFLFVEMASFVFGGCISCIKKKRKPTKQPTPMFKHVLHHVTVEYC